jgi:P27 family predicted phage terminase small subunit
VTLPGPKPLPPALKLLHGNPGKRPVTDPAVLPPAEPPAEPSWTALLPGPGARKPTRRELAAADDRLEVALVEGASEGSSYAAEVARRERDELLDLAERWERIETLRRDARLEWRRVVPALDKLGVLATVDGAMLTTYCVTWARFLECERDLSRRGLTLFRDRTGRDGTSWQEEVPNPFAALSKSYRDTLRRIAPEFGCTPSSRGRLQLPSGADDDDGDLFG